MRLAGVHYSHLALGVNGSRPVRGLSLWLVGASLQAVAAAPAPVSVAITFAEQPVTVARDTGMYSARRGTALLAHDLIVATSGTVLLDAGGTTVALGPASSLYIKDSELVLLNGWMKVNGSANGPLRLTTAGVQFDSAGVAATVHATPGSTELFAESAGVAVLELPASGTPRRVTVPREHFGARTGTQPTKVALRPPAAFLAGMPRTFLDPLVRLAAKGPAVPPKRDRAATFAELAPLLAEQPALRQQVQLRLAPARPARTVPPRTTNQLEAAMT